MQYENRFPKLCHIHRTIRTGRIVCTHLPDRLAKTFALSCFCPICAYYNAKSSFCRTVGGKPGKPIKRVDKPNQLTRVFRLFRHYIHCMPKLA